MMKHAISMVLGAVLSLTGCAYNEVMAQGCRFSEERTATVAPGDLQQLRVIARAGTLEVEGQAGLTEIQVSGKACASSESLLRQVRLIAERHSGEVLVEAVLPRTSGFESSSLDLVVRVPASMQLDVNDGSGWAKIHGAASLRFVDGSGAMEVSDIAGNVNIRDGSGSMEVARVGNLDVDDGSGEITIKEVHGTVRIHDGSGSLSTENVTGDVVITDGSGGITARDVSGNFTVERDGSGSIHYEGVAGRVSIPKS